MFRSGLRALLEQEQEEEFEVVGEAESGSEAARAAVDGHHYVDPALTSEVIDAYVDGAKRRPPGQVGVLTAREREVCRLLAYSHTNNEIAEKLDISSRTVESHRARIMSKLELSSRADLVRFAMDHGLMPRDASIMPT